MKDMFKKASKSVCTSTVVVYPDPLVSYSIKFFNYETLTDNLEYPVPCMLN
jgi:hypothetical protein